MPLRKRNIIINMHVLNDDQSTKFVSRIFRIRQSRSAESSPVMFVRRFRVSGKFYSYMYLYDNQVQFNFREN